MDVLHEASLACMPRPRTWQRTRPAKHYERLPPRLERYETLSGHPVKDLYMA
ncbi:hypothetical protein AB0M95_26415 [Sphaerisporangium sp. NPDC051017]|uniref:hypothetical protein n=1 Tax=Sphaerisporangium sp. NPDC051017 TaxID=3154636 RepID=UPI0034207CF3